MLMLCILIFFNLQMNKKCLLMMWTNTAKWGHGRNTSSKEVCETSEVEPAQSRNHDEVKKHNKEKTVSQNTNSHSTLSR